MSGYVLQIGSTGSLSSNDITSPFTVFNATIGSDIRRAGGILALSGLNGNDAIIAVHIQVGTYDMAPIVLAKSSASATTLYVSIPPFEVLGSGNVLIQIESSNSSDTGVSGSFRLTAADFGPADVLEWKGTAPADLTNTDKVQVSVQHMADGVLTPAKFNGNVPANILAITNSGEPATWLGQFVEDGSIGGTGPLSVNLNNNAITAAKINNGAFTADKFAAGAFDAVWSVSTRTLSSFGTLVSDIATAVWGATTRTLSAFGFTPTPSNAADTTAIKAKTDQLDFTGTAGALKSESTNMRGTDNASTFNPATTPVLLTEGTSEGQLPPLLRLLYSMVPNGTVDDSGFTPTTTSFESDITTAERYINQFVWFTSGSLAGQAALIDNTTSGIRIVTTTAFSAAPVNGNRFIIIGKLEPPA